MTTHERVVRNPLTDERLSISEYLCSLVDSARFDVLQALDGQLRTPSAIQNSGQLSRQTASKHLTILTERGLTKPTASQNGYELTAGGKLMLETLDSCFETIGREHLVSLTRSTHSLGVLRALSTGTARPRDLTETVAESPSRATVQRVLQTFTAAGWSSTRNGAYHLTPVGFQVVDAYDELVLTIEQTMVKAPWLQRLSPAHANVPVRALPDAKVVLSEPDSPGIVLGAALSLCDPRLSRFRVLTSIYNPTLFRAYDKLLKLGLAGEAIVDYSVYARLHDAGLEHFLDDTDYENFQIGRLEESLTLGIGIYDDRKVAIGAYNEAGEGDHIGSSRLCLP